MAARHGIANAPGLSTTAVAKTLIQLIAAPNHAIRLTEIGIGFHGTTNTNAPITVDLIRQTDAGTMSPLTPVKADDSVADTLDTTAQQDATAEPASGDVLKSWSIHPQTQMVLPIGDVAPVIVGAGDRVGLRVTAGTDVVADSYIAFEE